MSSKGFKETTLLRFAIIVYPCVKFECSFRTYAIEDASSKLSSNSVRSDISELMIVDSEPKRCLIAAFPWKLDLELYLEPPEPDLEPDEPLLLA